MINPLELDRAAERVSTFLIADASSRAKPRPEIAHTYKVTGSSHDSQLLAADLKLLVEAASGLNLRCPICRGSGMVAIGPWGSRPQRSTCEACLGNGIVELDLVVTNLLAAESALLKIRAALNVHGVDDQARVVGIRDAIDAWGLSK
ncbi:MAG: hypothetical protein JWN41_1808 [Thermoleophilia bacterium]|nr:hypothetical protein [Thermoleophilia bacterium]